MELEAILPFLDSSPAVLLSVLVWFEVRSLTKSFTQLAEKVAAIEAKIS